jgi:hypothetical protein
MPRRNSYDDYDRELNAWGNHQDYLREMEESEAHEAAMEAWRLANPELAAKQDVEQAMWDKKWAEIYAQADMVAAAEEATKPSLAPALAAEPKPKKTKAKKAKVPRSGVVAAADGWFTVVKRR